MDNATIDTLRVVRYNFNTLKEAEEELEKIKNGFCYRCGDVTKCDKLPFKFNQHVYDSIK